MHIPDSMLHGSVCPVTAGLSTAGIIAASYFCIKAKNKPSATEFGSITALIFAGQMMNFPIMSGTSGHLLGGVMASGLMGVPFGILSLALVVTLQSLVFSDGGVTVLGANVLNMALIGAGLGGLLYNTLVRQRTGKQVKIAAMAIASWASIILAALATSIELAMDGQIALKDVVPAMVGVHAWIGVGEAVITIACIHMLFTMPKRAQSHGHAALPLATGVLVALLLTPFASKFPDGLEWVTDKFQFLHESAPSFVGPLSDYTVPIVANESLSTGLAGLIGVAIVFALAWFSAKTIRFASRKNGMA